MEEQGGQASADGDEKSPMLKQGERQEETSGLRLQGSPEESSIDDDQPALFNFYLLTGVTETVGIICLVIVIAWVAHFRGGFAWDGSGKEFNYHPVFMVVGLVFLYGNGAMVYRVFRNTEKQYTKLAHMVVQILALIFTILGLVTVFDFHNKQNIPNMYSLHSWIGIAAVVLFGCQLLFGFLAFLFPKFPETYRAQYLMVHQYFGSAVFVIAVGNCLLGITEKLLFSIKPSYPKFVTEGILANVLGIFLVVFGGLVLHLVTHKSYRRRPDNRGSYTLIN